MSKGGEPEVVIGLESDGGLSERLTSFVVFVFHF